jgi:hypothetical protein
MEDSQKEREEKEKEEREYIMYRYKGEPLEGNLYLVHVRISLL